MLKINLLPESARKASSSSIEQFHRTPIMWIGFGILVAIPLLLVLPIRLSHYQLRHLRAKVDVLEPRKAEVDRTQRLLHQLRAEETAFQSIRQGQGWWAKRLNTLSDVTPDGVWFTDLALDDVKGLVIQGAAIAQADPEMVNVTRLVRELEKSPEFSSAIKDIQIESIKRTMDGEIEVVQFTLACALRQAAAPQ